MTPDPQTQFISQILGVFLAAVAGAWVMHDALQRGKKPGEAFLWALGTWMVLIVVLPLWLWLRPRQTGKAGSGFAQGYPTTFGAPEAGAATAKVCRYCGQPSGEDPYFCAACGRQLKGVGNQTP